MTTPKSIIIHGRRWFQKTNGNTYHTTQIFLDGKLVTSTPIRGGYEDHYLWTAFEWLETKGLIRRSRGEKLHSAENPWKYCERVGCTFEHFATDVGRKADL